MLTARLLPRVWVRIPQSPIIPNWYQDVAKSQHNGNQRQLHWPHNEIHNIRVCRSVGKNKMIIGCMDLKNKIFFYHITVLYSCTYMFSCTDPFTDMAGYSPHTLHVTETQSPCGLAMGQGNYRHYFQIYL
jgi:hypothetical protein